MRRTKATQPLKSKIEVPWDTTAINNAGSPQSMPLEQIILPHNQPRRYFDPEALKQLTESIKQHGILQPLLVRPLDREKHELVAGERRYRAAQEIGLKEVPVVIRQLDDNAAFQLALIENLLREDLNPVEETEGILQLLALKLGRNLEDIPPLLRRLQHERKEAALSSNNVIVKDADENLDVSNNVIGKDENDEQQGSNPVNPDLKIVEEVFEGLGLMTWESFANNRLPLLNLPEDILEALRKGSLEYTKAKAIAQIQNKDERVEFLEQAIAQNWSLSEIKQRISEKKSPASTPNIESNNYKERFTAATTKLKKSRIWSDPKKRKQIEKLLAQLEALTNVE
jgi:ParB family transcriptional regulator, chromosome partitioning protein